MLEFSAPALASVSADACQPPLASLDQAIARLSALPEAKLVFLARHGEGVHSE